MENYLIFVIVASLFQLIMVILFGIFTDYNDFLKPVSNSTTTDMLPALYPYFQDVQGMIFLGFGFLMCFLKRYSFSSIGINFFLAVLCIQWAMLINGFLHLSNGIIKLDANSLIAAEFATATVLISFGVILGKTTPLQLLIMGIIEIPLFAGNEYLGRYVLKVTDTGDSLFVHTFGAYFGLCLSRMIFKKQMNKSENEGSVYHSDVLAMIGTLILWIFWPSFNGGGVTGDRQHRAIINTFCSLIGSTFATFIVSYALGKGRICMVHVANATLSGGVAIGAAADLLIRPVGSLVIGLFTGTISTLGYKFLTPKLNRLGFHDTCGVNNLHGMPGIIAGVVVAIFSVFVTKGSYGDSLKDIFPTSNVRTPMQQGGFQMAALLVTMLIAGVTGALTGLLLRVPALELSASTTEDVYFNDSLFWETPEDFNLYHAPSSQNIAETAA